MVSSGQGKKQKSLSDGQMKNMLYDFCHSTSLHGYSYIVSNNSMVLKIAWIFVTLALTGLGIFFLSINTIEFFEANMTTNIESSSEPLTVSFSQFLAFLIFKISWYNRKLHGHPLLCAIWIKLKHHSGNNLDSNFLVTKVKFLSGLELTLAQASHLLVLLVVILAWWYLLLEQDLVVVRNLRCVSRLALAQLAVLARSSHPSASRLG